MSARNTRVVFDCNVYAQALINEVSPAGRCYALARSGDMILFVSAYVLEEIVELHLKLPARYGVTLDDCHALLNEIQTFAQLIESPSECFVHPLDPDDSPYVNLAIQANAELIISRDKHLLGLTDSTKPWSQEFRDRFSHIHILTPEQLLTERARPTQGKSANASN